MRPSPIRGSIFYGKWLYLKSRCISKLKAGSIPAGHGQRNDAAQRGPEAGCKGSWCCPEPPNRRPSPQSTRTPTSQTCLPIWKEARARAGPGRLWGHVRNQRGALGQEQSQGSEEKRGEQVATLHTKGPNSMVALGKSGEIERCLIPPPAIQVPRLFTELRGFRTWCQHGHMNAIFRALGKADVHVAGGFERVKHVRLKPGKIIRSHQEQDGVASPSSLGTVALRSRRRRCCREATVHVAERLLVKGNWRKTSGKARLCHVRCVAGWQG